MIAFDLVSAVLADLDGIAPEPVEPVAPAALAPLEALETLGFSSGASGASPKQTSWLENEINADAGCNDAGGSATQDRGNMGLAWGTYFNTGSSGSTGITAENKGLQRGQSGSCTGSTGPRNEELRSVWTTGIKRLKSCKPPAGVTQYRWDDLLFAVNGFTAAWASSAIALGWDTLSVFGSQSAYPLSAKGCLLVEAARYRADIIALTTDCAVLRRRDGRGIRYIYRDDIPAEMVLVWEAVR